MASLILTRSFVSFFLLLFLFLFLWHQYYHPKTGKDLYQIEVPDAVLKRAEAPSDFVLKSRKKGVRRFWSPEIREWMPELEKAKMAVDAALKARRKLRTHCGTRADFYNNDERKRRVVATATHSYTAWKSHSGNLIVAWPLGFALPLSRLHRGANRYRT